MFQSALIRRHASGERQADAGTIAETLLFYRSVHIVAEGGLLADLLRVIGPESLVNLLENKYISMTYSRSIPAVMTNTENFVSTHSFTAVRTTTDKDGRRIDAASEISKIVFDQMGKSRKSKNTVKSLLGAITLRRIGPQTLDECIELTSQALDDPVHTAQAVRSLLNFVAPSYKIPADFDFRMASSDGVHFFALTNLDYKSINAEYHKTVSPTHSSITTAYLLSFILNATIDLNLSASYSSELVASDEISFIIRLKIRRMLERRDRSIRDIELFQEALLKEARAVREAINSGERTFDEFLPILSKARRFKQWLSERNPDTNLLGEYYRSVTGESWIGGLPGKTLRYVMTSTAGLAGLLPGLAAGALDEFVVDRLFKGWRPNQFVEGPLRRFTSVE